MATDWGSIAIAAVVVIVVYYVWTFFNGTADFLIGIGQGISNFFGGVWSDVGQLGSSIGGAASATANWFGSGLGQIGAGVGSAASATGSFFGGVGSGVTSGVEGGAAAVSGAFSSAGSAVANAFGSL